jgi:hypothetical protein
MKWSEAIKNLDTSPENEAFVDIEPIAKAVGISFYYVDQNWLKKFWITKWLCTDTYVGLAVYTLDGEPVAISTQTGRKMDEHISFLSEAAFKKVQEFIYKLWRAELEEEPSEFVNLEEDISPSWFENAAPSVA